MQLFGALRPETFVVLLRLLVNGSIVHVRVLRELLRRLVPAFGKVLAVLLFFAHLSPFPVPQRTPVPAGVSIDDFIPFCLWAKRRDRRATIRTRRSRVRGRVCGVLHRSGAPSRGPLPESPARCS